MELIIMESRARNAVVGRSGQTLYLIFASADSVEEWVGDQN